MADSSYIDVGRVMGAFGVQGWVRIASYTDPPENLFKMTSLVLYKNQQRQPVHVIAFQPHQQGWVAQFTECPDRDCAQAWYGAQLQIKHSELPTLPENQYYWVDLQGLQVINEAQQVLGYVDHLFETGANDVMVIKQGKNTCCIPYVFPHIVKVVDLEKKLIIVDWEP